MRGYAGYNMGPDFDPRRPYDASWDTVPVPGLSSGMLPSGMNFDYLPPQTPIMQMVAPPSPLQQLVALGNSSESGTKDAKEYPPMRTCHMTGPEASLYNGLVGDVVKVSMRSNHDGTQVVLFDLRIPLDSRTRWYPDMVKDKDHKDIPPSQEAMAAAEANRKSIRPEANLYTEESMGPPPYLMLKKLPSEKMQPVGNSGHGMRPTGPPGVEMLPSVQRQPIWGEPAGPQREEYLQAQQNNQQVMLLQQAAEYQKAAMECQEQARRLEQKGKSQMQSRPMNSQPGMPPTGPWAPGAGSSPPMNPFQTNQSMHMR